MTIKKKVFETLEKKGYVSDVDVFHIFGEDESKIDWWLLAQYTGEWKRMRRDEDRFGDSVKSVFHFGGRRKQYCVSTKYADVSLDNYNNVKDSLVLCSLPFYKKCTKNGIKDITSKFHEVQSNMYKI